MNSPQKRAVMGHGSGGWKRVNGGTNTERWARAGGYDLDFHFAECCLCAGDLADVVDRVCDDCFMRECKREYRRNEADRCVAMREAMAF